MGKILAVWMLTCCSFLQAQVPSATVTTGASAAVATNGKEISGVVRIIRGQPQTEVFFKDLKDSVIIPHNSKHNQIYEACEVSWKKGSPVKLIIDPISRQVLSLPSTATDGATNSALKEAPSAGKDSSKATDFKPVESSPDGVK